VANVKKRPLYIVAIVVAGVVIAAVALTGVLAAGGGSNQSGGAGTNPTAAPASTAGGQPPLRTATASGSGSSIAPGEPTPPPGTTRPPAASATPLPASPTPAPGTMRVLAPVQSADMAVLTSFPPQYAVKVTAGLPSGCAKADGSEVTQSGNEIRVAVYNTMPSGPIACTQIFGTYDLTINLGSNFVTGQDYRVSVNGKMLTFTAQ
jgi:hypothetical protein